MQLWHYVSETSPAGAHTTRNGGSSVGVGGRGLAARACGLLLAGCTTPFAQYTLGRVTRRIACAYSPDPSSQPPVSVGSRPHTVVPRRYSSGLNFVVVLNSLVRLSKERKKRSAMWVRAGERKRKMRVALLLLGGIVVLSVTVARALSCVCSPIECDSLTEDDCPGGLTWDPCK